MFYRKTCSKNFLKDIYNPSKMRGAYWVFTKKSKYFPKISQGHFEKNMDFMPVKSNKNHNISCSNSGVITSQIELANLTKARKSKKHCSFLVKYCKCLFFFLVFFAPSSSSTSFFFSPAVFCKFLTKFFELPGHVCYQAMYATASHMLTISHL